MTQEQNIFEDNGAEFSECGKYRYSLWRIWDKEKPLVMFIGLNPSTAGVSDNDPTIRCVIKFAKQWGYGGFYMMNCWAYISSNPDDLRDHRWNELVCDWNDNMLTIKKSVCKDVDFAWGKFPIIKETGRERELKEMFPNAFCIGQKNGSPFHPLWAGVYAPKEMKAQFSKPIKF
jgi:hypothetical protein